MNKLKNFSIKNSKSYAFLLIVCILLIIAIISGVFILRSSKNKTPVHPYSGLPYKQDANTETGISWDGKTPIVYTYSDGSSGYEKKAGARYELAPGKFKFVSIYEIEIDRKSLLTKTADQSINDDLISIGPIGSNNTVKKNKELNFSANIKSLGSLVFRHGKEVYDSGYVVIDSNKIEVYSYLSSEQLTKSVKHGLDLTGNVKIRMTVGNTPRLAITINTETDSFSVDNIYWSACNGTIEMKNIDSELTNVNLSWDSEDFDKDIWVFGDSYLTLHSTRWPQQLIDEGYTNFMLYGFPGAHSNQMYDAWKSAITMGKPKYVVWCLGMNDGDSEKEANSSWLQTLKSFLEDCKKYGITPILATIPNTPTVINTFKNDYIKSTGLRYIDFASAVGANELYSSWHKNMLNSDNVHPDLDGGIALAEQIKLDFPEIVKK